MSKYPSLSKRNNSDKTSKSFNVLFPARVKDILLSNDQPFFEKSEGWADIGLIQFKPLYKSVDTNNVSILYAKPLYTNIKQYPIKEEIVLILNAPSNKLNDNPNATDFYYFPFPIGIWNSIHHNSFPDIPNYEFDPKDLNLGNIFKEKEGIRNLLPEEGDVLVEGRFGNSIRLSSTSNKKNNRNPWSDTGENGKPIIIIRNGQVIQNNSSPWTPIYEDINGDDSSIYLTSGQELPLELGSKNLKSFNVTLSNSFNSSLQILDSNNFQ